MHNIILLLVCFFCSSLTTIADEQKILLMFKPFKIDVIAPSGKPTKEELIKLTEIAKSLNLNIPKDIIRYDIPQSYIANTDEDRFNNLKTALLNDDDSIIWCIRGGYGVTRIMRRLFSLQPPNRKKIFIGYSDITALHLFLSQEWGWRTIHGTVISELLYNKDRNNLENIFDIISYKNNITKLTDLKPINKHAKEVNHVQGLLTGGNATIIESSIGTRWQMQGKDKIVFLEDVGVIGFRLDRIFHHFIDAGIFDGVKAIILGQFSDGDKDIETVINDFSNIMEIPVYRSSKFGHEKINYPLIYNSNSEIKSTINGAELIMSLD